MKAFAGLRPLRRRPALPGALALLLVAACATNPPRETGSPGADDVDVGYGAVDPDHVVSSGTTVDVEGEGAGRFRSIGEMLSRVPGLQVSEGPGGLSVRVRGVSSFQGGQEPLFVLDGMSVPSVAGLSGVHPSTIESITVLKDAGETAIYGSRGANGVILIRTRRTPK